jgi:hypothetical protein
MEYGSSERKGCFELVCCKTTTRVEDHGRNGPYHQPISERLLFYFFYTLDNAICCDLKSISCFLSNFSGGAGSNAIKQFMYKAQVQRKDLLSNSTKEYSKI